MAAIAAAIAQAQPSSQEYRVALVTCSDARVPPSSILPFEKQGEVYVVENAGNLVVPLPKSIETVLLVGHEEEEGRGCGACHATAEFVKSESQTELSEGLTSIVTTCKPNTRENLQVQRQGYEVQGQRVIPFIYNHAKGELKLTDEAFASDPLTGFLLRYNIVVKDNSTTQTINGNIRDGQNPNLIAVTLVPQDFAQLVPEYKGVNRVFEVKPGVPAERLSLIDLGSAEYAWSHALQEKGSFTTTMSTIITVPNRDFLGALAAQLSQNEALNGYRERGGEVVAMVLGKEGVYQLR